LFEEQLTTSVGAFSSHVVARAICLPWKNKVYFGVLDCIEGGGTLTNTTNGSVQTRPKTSSGYVLDKFW